MAFDDGQGHLLQRGTSARVFSPPLLTSTLREQDESEKNEGRIAEALKIDRIRKVLDFCSGRSVPRCLVPNRGLKNADEHRTTWNGYQWIGQESVRGESGTALRNILELTKTKPLRDRLRSVFFRPLHTGRRTPCPLRSCC